MQCRDCMASGPSACLEVAAKFLWNTRLPRRVYAVQRGLCLWCGARAEKRHDDKTGHQHTACPACLATWNWEECDG